MTDYPYKCKIHPNRDAECIGKCWECIIGLEMFIVKMGVKPEEFYGETK